MARSDLDVRTQRYATFTVVVFASLVVFALVTIVAFNRTLVLPIVSLASLAMGGLFGFLFAFPRAETPPSTSPALAPTGRRVTNMELISDSLTKMLVGITLASLGKLPSIVASLAAYLADHGGNPRDQASYACATVFFLVAGIFLGYIVMRFYLSEAFAVADGRVLTAEERAETIDRSYEQGLALRGGDKALDDQVVENALLNYLYLEAPVGFQRVLKVGSEYVATRGDKNEIPGNVWMYLAAASGQAYSWGEQSGASEADLARYRSDAIGFVRNTLERAPHLLPMLKEMTRPGVVDDDLVPFKDDPELKKLLAIA